MATRPRRPQPGWRQRAAAPRRAWPERARRLAQSARQGSNRAGGKPNRAGGRPNGVGGLGQLGSRRNLIIAAVAVAVLVVAVIAYGAGGGHKPPAPASSPGTTAKAAAKPKPHMLGAGRTGRRSAIPWSLVGAGWAVAEFSTAQPNSAGQASATGGHRYTTYLVDPDGGKYKITTSTAGAQPELLAWSGNALTALFGSSSGTPGGVSSYQLLNVRSGHCLATDAARWRSAGRIRQAARPCHPGSAPGTGRVPPAALQPDWPAPEDSGLDPA